MSETCHHDDFIWEYAIVSLKRVESLDECLRLLTGQLTDLCREQYSAPDDVKMMLDKSRMVTSAIRGCQHLFEMRAGIEARWKNKTEEAEADMDAAQNAGAEKKPQAKKNPNFDAAFAKLPPPAEALATAGEPDPQASSMSEKKPAAKPATKDGPAPGTGPDPLTGADLPPALAPVAANITAAKKMSGKLKAALQNGAAPVPD